MSRPDPAASGLDYPQWAREILRCPVDHGELDDVAAATGPQLRCRDCGRAYPVVDGIPVLLADEAV